MEQFKLYFLSVLQQLRHNVIQVFTANVVNKIVVMISNMIITRLLTKSQYGLWSYVLNIYSYASLVSGLGLASGVFQFGVENRGKKEEFGLYKYCLSVGLIINSIISLIFIGGSWVIKYSIPDVKKFISIYLPILLLEYIIEILLTILRCKDKIGAYAKLININTILVAFFTCAGANFGVLGVIIGKYIAAVISIIYIIKNTRHYLTEIIKTKLFPKWLKKELWHYSVFTGMCSTLNRVLYLLDVSMIASLMKNAMDVAVYKVATLIPNSLEFIPSSVIIVILPNIISNKEDAEWLKKNIRVVYIGLFILNLIIGSFLIVLAPFVIGIISGKQYLDAVPPFRILVLGYIVAGTFRNLSTNILAGLKYVTFNLIISITTGIADIMLNYFLIKNIGMIGAAYATLGVELIASVLSFLFVVKAIKKKQMIC